MSSAAELHPAPGAASLAGGQVQTTTQPAQTAASAQGSTTGGTGGVASTAAGSNLSSRPSNSPQDAGAKPGRLVAFEGFLKKAGHIAGVVLTDIVKYVIPVASLVAVADPAAAPAVSAFTASVRLVQATAISVQQKWAVEGTAANAQKLADVLEIVEQPVITMFAQAGLQVDTAYVTNLVNGVVAILNAQPDVVLPKAA